MKTINTHYAPPESEPTSNKVKTNPTPTTQQLFAFFAECDLHLSLIFPRNILLDTTKHETIQKQLHVLKRYGFKSSYLSSLQRNSCLKQKWPLINLVRQLFKVCGYWLKPVRVSDGYSKTGKKQFKRYFKIEKLQDNTPKQENISDENKIITLETSSLNNEQ